jgi:hypothetical protein
MFPVLRCKVASAGQSDHQNLTLLHGLYPQNLFNMTSIVFRRSLARSLALYCRFFYYKSCYKFYDTYRGVLFGQYKHLESLAAYKVRPAPTDPPGKFETGTQNHESIAGVLGAIEYLEWVGETFGELRRKVLRVLFRPSPEAQTSHGSHPGL